MGKFTFDYEAKGAYYTSKLSTKRKIIGCVSNDLIGVKVFKRKQELGLGFS